MEEYRIQLPESVTHDHVPRIEHYYAAAEKSRRMLALEGKILVALKKHLSSKLVNQMYKTKNFRILSLLSISLKGLAAYGELPHTIIVTNHSGFRRHNVASI